MEHQAPAAPSGATGAEVWRRYPLDVAPAGLQVERALGMIAAGAPLPALCWYWAVEPTLILGVFQPPEVINEAAAAARGVPLVRRRSGGTGVLAGPPLLSLDIALPPGHRLALPDVTESYHWLGRAWLATMEAIGVRGARLVSIAEVRAEPHRPLRRLPDGPIPDEDLVRLACFGALSPYEVAIGPRKLVGFSQVRRRAGLLLQVGLPLTWEADFYSRPCSPRARTTARAWPGCYARTPWAWTSYSPPSPPRRRSWRSLSRYWPPIGACAWNPSPQLRRTRRSLFSAPRVTGAAGSADNRPAHAVLWQTNSRDRMAIDPGCSVVCREQATDVRKAHSGSCDPGHALFVTFH